MKTGIDRREGAMTIWKGDGSGSSAMQGVTPRALRHCRVQPVGMWGSYG